MINILSKLHIITLCFFSFSPSLFASYQNDTIEYLDEFITNSNQSIFNNKEKIILVHTSNILSENNTKIAGSQFFIIDDQTLHIDPENIRIRIGLFHCLGGIVPNTKHGVSLYGIKLDSHLHKDKDVSAYLDPLSHFEGEVFGGPPYDFMTIDQHVYGKDSTIIVPLHKENEFYSKNPNYEGRLITYDPNQDSIQEKIDEVIKDVYKGPNLTDINAVENIANFLHFCSKHKYYNKIYAFSNFNLLETILSKFREIIYCAKKQKISTLIPADQIEPLSIVINTLFESIESQSRLTLSEEKIQSIQNWIINTNDWLTIFKIDAKLRLNHQKSLFFNTLDFTTIINNKHDAAYLYKLSKALPCITQESTLNISEKKFFTDKIVENLTNVSFDQIIKIQQNLNNAHYTSYGDGLMLIHLIKQLNKDNKNADTEEKEQSLLNLLKNLIPSDEIKYHLTKELEYILIKDNSFMNQKVIDQLNSPIGKKLRQKIWNDHSTIDFWTLLTTNKNTAILFKDLDDLEDAKNLDPSIKHFIQIVRQWLLKKAINNSMYIPECTDITCAPSEPKCTSAEHKNLHCSLFNLNYAIDLSEKISFYITGLCGNIDHPNNPLHYLIKSGCFESWNDLLCQLSDINALSEKRLSIFKQNVNNCTIYGLILEIRNSLEKQQDDLNHFKENMPIYQDIEKQIATASETEINLNGFGGLDWYIDVLLQQCIHGYHKEIGENKITILPNLEAANILYEKLYKLADNEQRIKLDNAMFSLKK